MHVQIRQILYYTRRNPALRAGTGDYSEIIAHRHKVIVDGSSSVTTVCDDVSCRLSTVKISLYCLRHPLRGIEAQCAAMPHCTSFPSVWLVSSVLEYSCSATADYDTLIFFKYDTV